MKICTKCGKVKEEGEFTKDKKSKDGFSYWCKACQKLYYTNNAERVKKYRKSNVEKRGKYHKEWYKNNHDKRKEQTKEYRNFLSSYNTFAPQISYADEVRRDPANYDLLQVKCTYCHEWFNPIISSIRSRITSLEGKGFGERRLYCSDECKQLCPIFNQVKYPKDQKPYPIPRDAQAQWAEMVKERDGYKCIKCGSTENLIAHHKEGIHWNPLESADIDIGVTLCQKCDKEAHSIEGCSYSDMRCNNEDV